MSVNESVIKAIKEKVKPGIAVTEETVLKDLGLDSLDFAEIIMESEDEFGISFSDDDMASISTVSDVIRLVNEKRK